MMKKAIVCLALCCCVFSGWAATKSDQDKDKQMDKFITALMKKMTLEEKLGQLNLGAAGDPKVLDSSYGMEETVRHGLCSSTPANGNIRELQRIAVEESRLGIPILFGLDVIHGYVTTFPIPLAQASSWNIEYIERGAQIAAKEATAMGVSWTWSPMVDICRDPRWGRVAEGAGEDPFLGSRIAEAMVHGYQGKDLACDSTLLACFKHFALYGASEGGRDYNVVDMSKLRMYNYYLPPYKAAVDAGCGTGMSSFNVVDDVPATGNKWLLNDLLRGEWGFKGFVVSDAGSVGEMKVHGVGDEAKIGELGINAGLDMDMGAQIYVRQMMKLLKEGRVKMATIDQSVRRILEAKYKLGLFDDPYRYIKLQEDSARQADLLSDEHVAFARKFAAESIVLLKNDDNTLPLEGDKLKKVAVVGPLGGGYGELFGTWSTHPDGRKSLSVFDALREAMPKCQVEYYQGCPMPQKASDGNKVYYDYYTETLPEETLQMIDKAVEGSKDADVIVATVGEHSGWSGEAQCRVDPSLFPDQKALLAALMKTGKPVVVVVFSGRPLVLTDEYKHFPAMVEAWHGGTQAGQALADVLTGTVNPSAKTTITFPRFAGQIPIYYNHLNGGRPLSDFWASTKYIDITRDENEPLFPFGYGLSYNTYSYSEPRITKNQLAGESDEVEISVDVCNQGKREGKEVIQLYITDPVASISRPVKELKGFQKVDFQPGEKKTITFHITTDLLKFYNSQLQYGWEPGDFVLSVGPNSRDVQSVTVHWEK